MNDFLHRRLIELVNSLAVQRGDLTLASGEKSSYYMDMCHATLHYEAGLLVGHIMLDMLEEAGFDVGMADAVDGLTMGADPMIIATMHVATFRGFGVDTLVVRKEAKDHGTKRRVEGSSIEGRNVVILEGTSTTSDSPI